VTVYTASAPAGTSERGTGGSSQIGSLNPYQLALTAGSLYVRIVKIERTQGSLGLNGSTGFSPYPYALTRYTGLSVSGGAGAVTPIALREGGPPASSTARYGTAGYTATYNSGGSYYSGTVTSTPLTLTGGTASILRNEPSVADYAFPNQVIMAPGSTFLVSGIALPGSWSDQSPNYSLTGYYGFTTLAIFFEELRLTGAL